MMVFSADGVFRARQVVVATGPFQAPHVPPTAQRLDGSVSQLHSAGYRNPRTLPPGPVLVVDGGNSGFQIAGELAATRQVDLSIATKAPVLPQRLAGKDLFWWLTRLGLMRVTAGSRLDTGCGPGPTSSSAAAAAGSGRPGSGSGPRWRRGRPHRPVRRRQQPGRRHRDLDHRLPPGLLLDTHPRRSR